MALFTTAFNLPLTSFSSLDSELRTKLAGSGLQPIETPHFGTLPSGKRIALVSLIGSDAPSSYLDAAAITQITARLHTIDVFRDTVLVVGVMGNQTFAIPMEKTRVTPFMVDGPVEDDSQKKRLDAFFAKYRAADAATQIILDEVIIGYVNQLISQMARHIPNTTLTSLKDYAANGGDFSTSNEDVFLAKILDRALIDIFTTSQPLTLTNGQITAAFLARLIQLPNANRSILDAVSDTADFGKVISAVDLTNTFLGRPVFEAFTTLSLPANSYDTIADGTIDPNVDALLRQIELAVMQLAPKLGADAATAQPLHVETLTFVNSPSDATTDTMRIAAPSLRIVLDNDVQTPAPAPEEADKESTTPPLVPVVLSKKNDTAGNLIDINGDLWIKTNTTVNVFDLSLDTSQAGFSIINNADVIARGGSVKRVLVKNVETGEYTHIDISQIPKAFFVPPANAIDDGVVMVTIPASYLTPADGELSIVVDIRTGEVCSNVNGNTVASGYQVVGFQLNLAFNS